MADDPPSSITATTSKDTGGGEAYTSPYAPSAVDLDGIVGRVAALDPTSMDGWIPEMVRGAPTLNGRGLLGSGEPTGASSLVGRNRHPHARRSACKHRGNREACPRGPVLVSGASRRTR